MFDFVKGKRAKLEKLKLSYTHFSHQTNYEHTLFFDLNAFGANI